MSQPVDDLEALRAEVHALRGQVSALERARRRRGLGWLGLAVLVSASAWAQLVTFAPDSPARADEVNQNFQQLKTWLEQKVGAVGQPTSLTGAQLTDNSVASADIEDNTLASVDIQDNTLTTADLLDGTVANVDLAPTLRCPTAAHDTYGQCIFFRPASGGPYLYTFRAAADACKAEGARLCSYAEVSAAQAAGLEVCAFGWFADRSSDTIARRGYPMQTTIAGCGTAGVNVQDVAMTTLSGAWCCK